MITRRQFVLAIPALGLSAAAFLHRLRAAQVAVALIRRWESRASVVATVPSPHVDATDGELAALDAAVRQDR